MWTDQDDFDEETDMLIFGMCDDYEEKKSSGKNKAKNTSKKNTSTSSYDSINTGSCLLPFLIISGIFSLPIIGALWLLG